VFGEGILDRLPEQSVLHDSSNDFRKVFIATLGALLDDFDLDESKEGVYLQNATGVYLDLHGKDLGVKRRFEETDEHYRNRLIYETLGYLTVDYLLNVYDLTLYTYVTGFDVAENTLVSDNPFIGDEFMCPYDEGVVSSLSSNFVLGNCLYWINSLGTLDYVLKGSVNVLGEYPNIYNRSGLSKLFKDNTLLTKVSLKLDNALKILEMFRGCTGLSDVVLVCDSVTDCRSLFNGCTGLESVTLSVPLVEEYANMFKDCDGLEYIDLTVPEDSVSAVTDYIIGLSLSNLETLIINGEEVDLS